MIVPITFNFPNLSMREWEHLFNDDERISALLRFKALFGELNPVFPSYDNIELSLIRLQTVRAESAYFSINGVYFNGPKRYDATPTIDVSWDRLQYASSSIPRIKEIGVENLIYRPRFLAGVDACGTPIPIKLITVDAYYPEK